ncbi:hypothetical protein CDAR_395111 [Caerostris darwini]|uniref:Uncharacterized protein n=1 Tax=Caerostris darwini TaxID=1538125 RepID=A0AAV4QB38_9ARAC|nr:hypothetical protein CDAR_395111 [Caerostris darwini]
MHCSKRHHTEQSGLCTAPEDTISNNLVYALLQKTPYRSRRQSGLCTALEDTIPNNLAYELLQKTPYRTIWLMHCSRRHHTEQSGLCTAPEDTTTNNLIYALLHTHINLVLEDSFPCDNFTIVGVFS